MPANPAGDESERLKGKEVATSSHLRRRRASTQIPTVGGSALGSVLKFGDDVPPYGCSAPDFAHPGAISGWQALLTGRLSTASC